MYCDSPQNLSFEEVKIREDSLGVDIYESISYCFMNFLLLFKVMINKQKNLCDQLFPCSLRLCNEGSV